MLFSANAFATNLVEPYRKESPVSPSGTKARLTRCAEEIRSNRRMTLSLRATFRNINKRERLSIRGKRDKIRPKQ